MTRPPEPAAPPLLLPEVATPEAIALAVVEAGPLAAVERISGPALTALAQGYLNRHDTDPSTEET